MGHYTVTDGPRRIAHKGTRIRRYRAQGMSQRKAHPHRQAGHPTVAEKGIAESSESEMRVRHSDKDLLKRRPSGRSLHKVEDENAKTDRQRMPSQAVLREGRIEHELWAWSSEARKGLAPATSNLRGPGFLGPFSSGPLPHSSAPRRETHFPRNSCASSTNKCRLKTSLRKSGW